MLAHLPPSGLQGAPSCSLSFPQGTGVGTPRAPLSLSPCCVSAVADESFPQAVIVPQDLIVTKNEEAMFDCQFAAVPPPTQEWLFEDNPISNRSK